MNMWKWGIKEGMWSLLCRRVQLSMPDGLFEISLSIWLIVKEFKGSELLTS